MLGESLDVQCKKLIFFIFILSLMALPLWNEFSTKLIHIAGGISFIYIIFNFRRLSFKLPVVMIFVSIFLLGVINLAWSSLFKGHSVDFINAYRGPMEFGKIAVFSSFSFLALLTNYDRDKQNYHDNLFIYPALVTQLIYFLYALWQYFYLHIDRVAFSTIFATSAAYMYLFTSLFTAIIIIGGKNRHLLLLVNFFFSLCVIYMTGTRGAILVYPILYLCVILLNSIIAKKLDYKLIGLSVVIFISVSLAFKTTVEKRVSDLNQDMTSYSQADSDSSVGARLAMYEGGLRTYAFWGQSLERRADKFYELDKNEPRIGGALIYLGSHLHNDIIETLSTRGVPGVLFILFFYLAFTYYAIFVVKNYYLLILLAAPAVLGLSDVILFSKASPTAMMTVLLLMCLYAKNRLRQESD